MHFQPNTYTYLYILRDVHINNLYIYRSPTLLFSLSLTLCQCIYIYIYINYECTHTPIYIYIYIYIYKEYIYLSIYRHPQTDCFVVSQLFSVARHVGRLKLGSKPGQVYVRLSIRPFSQQANHVS